MKCLILYYSRSGNTKMVAEQLAQLLKCDISEIKETNTKKGIFEVLRITKDAFFKKSPSIQPVSVDPQNYDLVIIGTPVWSGVAAPMRTYLQQNKDKIKKFAIFCTLNRAMYDNTVEEAKGILEKEPIASLKVLTKEVKLNSFIDNLNEFASKFSSI